MFLRINGEDRTLSQLEQPSVSDLLTALAVEQTRGLAVAVNAQVVPRSDWGAVRVEDGDHVEIIRATQGG